MFLLKKYLKLIICSFLYYSGLLHIYLQYFFPRRKEFPVVILNYHSFVERMDDVIDVEPSVTHLIDDFKKELRFFKKYFDVASLDAVVDTLRASKKFIRPTIAITVDDGLKNNYDLFFPAVKAEKVPVTVFLTAGLIGTNERVWWDKLAYVFAKTAKNEFSLAAVLDGKEFPLNSLSAKRRAYVNIVEYLKGLPTKDRDECVRQIAVALAVAPENDAGMLTWEQVREMARENVTFGAHTCNHPILTRVPREEAKMEIAESKRIIEKELGVPIWHFAFPNGGEADFNEDLKNFCKGIGFESISTCIFGNNSNERDLLALKRMGHTVPLSLFFINVIRAALAFNR